MHLNYQTYGSGSRALLVLHGLLGSSDNWHTLAKRFGEQYHVYTIDARNHGRSPHSDAFNYRVMAEDVLEFMRQQNLGSAHLLGHSMGGKTAMFFAVAYPGHVDKLIVVDIAPKASSPSHDEIFDALFSLALPSFSFRKDIDAALAKKIPNLTTRQFLLKNLSRESDGSFRWKMNLATIRKNYEGINDGVPAGKVFNKPTLFVRGEKSRYVLDEDFDMIRKVFPASTIATIPNAGHWIHAEAPEEFGRVVMEFLVGR